MPQEEVFNEQMEQAHMHICPMALAPIERDALPEPLRERYDGVTADFERLRNASPR